MKNDRYLLLGREHMALVRTRIFAIILVCVAACFLTPPQCHGFSFMPNKAERIRNAGNLYEKPAKNSSAIANLKSGNTVTLIFRQGEWYIVKLSDNRLGWAHHDLFLDKASASETGKPVSGKEKAKLPAVSEASKVPAKKGARITLKARMGHVRAAPSLDSEMKFRLKKGNSVSILQTKENWYLVRLDDGSTGWVHKGLFSEPGQGQAPQPQVVTKPVPPPESDTRQKAAASAKLSPTAPKRKPVPRKPQAAAQQPSPKPVPATTAPVQADVGVPEIREIRVDVTADGEEKVVFVLNGFFPPKTFTVQDDIPKVVCDFPKARLARGVNRNISVRGRFIQKIRIGFHSEKIRAVVDLSPNKSYDVDQTFFKKESLYTLTFKAN